MTSSLWKSWTWEEACHRWYSWKKKLQRNDMWKVLGNVTKQLKLFILMIKTNENVYFSLVLTCSVATLARLSLVTVMVSTDFRRYLLSVQHIIWTQQKYRSYHQYCQAPCQIIVLSVHRRCTAIKLFYITNY